MDFRLNGQPNQDPPPSKSSLGNPLSNTTQGNIFLLFDARIRRSEKSSKTPPTEGDMGSWGKSYAKAKFMSGEYLIETPTRAIPFTSNDRSSIPEILEAEILGGNVKQYWEKREGMALLPYVFKLTPLDAHSPSTVAKRLNCAGRVMFHCPRGVLA